MCHLSKGPGGGLGKRAPQSLREFIPTLPSSPLPHLYSFSPPLLFTLLLIFSPFCTPPPSFFLLTVPGAGEKVPAMFAVFPAAVCTVVCLCLQGRPAGFCTFKKIQKNPFRRLQILLIVLFSSLYDSSTFSGQTVIYIRAVQPHV